MIIFKRISLKVQSALQDHEGGGGQGNKIIIQMFLPDSTYLYINTSTHRHIRCTHSLSLSLSLSTPHTHTHTRTHTHAPHTTHTLTRSKSGRYELIRFLEVEEIVCFCFFRADLMCIIRLSCHAAESGRSPGYASVWSVGISMLP